MPDTMITPVHFPAKPDQFEFDAEVSQIFPNMAERSIPNYRLFHAMHAEIVARWFARPHISMLDVGASHGGFYEALKNYYRDTESSDPAPRIFMHAVDNSEAMCEIMREKHPDVMVSLGSITDEDFMGRFKRNLQFDVVNATYLLQFIEPEKQMAALRSLTDLVRPGGILILGQKESMPGMLGHMLQEQYVRWRMRNGYTREEIEAKTRALAGSMWPMDQENLLYNLRRDFRDVQETTRMFMFSTLIAYK